jgi:hypothetical protein
LTTKVLVDGTKIELNEFAEKILSGIIVGAVTPLRGIQKDWTKIEISITR